MATISELPKNIYLRKDDLADGHITVGERIYSITDSCEPETNEAGEEATVVGTCGSESAAEGKPSLFAWVNDTTGDVYVLNDDGTYDVHALHPDVGLQLRAKIWWDCEWYTKTYLNNENVDVDVDVLGYCLDEDSWNQAVYGMVNNSENPMAARIDAAFRLAEQTSTSQIGLEALLQLSMDPAITPGQILGISRELLYETAKNNIENGNIKDEASGLLWHVIEDPSASIESRLSAIYTYVDKNPDQDREELSAILLELAGDPAATEDERLAIGFFLSGDFDDTESAKIVFLNLLEDPTVSDSGRVRVAGNLVDLCDLELATTTYVNVTFNSDADPETRLEAAYRGYTSQANQCSPLSLT